MSKNPIQIRSDLRPGDIGAIIYLHGILYAREYGFDHTFEPYVAAPLAGFVKNYTDRERIWIVEKQGQVVGSIAIVQHSQNQAQLRWLILDPAVRGLGIGKRLVEKAVDFCRASGYASIFLWTIDFLGAALKLYRAAGFELTDTNTHPVWGRILTEERYELKLK
jgi:N-acetylglutamate synthase-like GNAT family acetyltransferase